MPARVVSTVAATRRGSGKSNQDRAFALPHATGVLDGASSEKPGKRDGGWYAGALSAELRQALETDKRRALRPMLRDAIATIATKLDEDRPSATVGLIRWTQRHLDVLVLGDITAVFFLVSGEQLVLTDDRLDAVAPELRHAYKENLRAGHGFDNPHRTNLAALQTAQFAARNSVAGYWVAEADAAAAGHALHRTLSMEEVAAALLITDGVAKAVTHYRLFGWETLRRVIARDGPDELIDQICTAEAGDPHGRRWPRGKLHDDKTLSYSTFTTISHTTAGWKIPAH